jgi:glycosyltransferase involved in cell wall biosynthesis
VRFLLINQFFPPDGAPTGQLLADVARALAAEGHAVTVLCGRVRYSGAEHPPRDPEIDGIIFRHPWAASFGFTPAARLASYATFYAGVLRHVLFGPRPDVVLTLSTPPLLSVAGALAKILRGAEFFSWEMDVYPDIATDLGFFSRGSLVDRLTGAFGDFARRRCERVIALGSCMKRRLVARGVPPEKVVVAENWADGDLISPEPFPPPEPLTILYSGNFGRAHDVDTIGEAMRLLPDPERFRFVFAGSGSRHPQLQSYCKTAGIANVFFVPYAAPEHLSRHLGGCHAGLVTQLPATCGSVVPSKTYALMAAGRPFIFVGPEGATPNLLIERFGCGWRVAPGDSSALVDLLELLASDPGLVQAAGARARQAFLGRYDVPQGVARIMDALGLAKVLSCEALDAKEALVSPEPRPLSTL